MTYVDGFVLCVPKDKIGVYTEMATGAGKIWKEHGALDYKECILDHDQIEGVRSFISAADAKEEDTAIFSFIVYHSREHRDEVNAKVMGDERLKDMCGEKMPFDVAKMAYGGFKPIVET